jgi:hypothetical protein
MSFFKKLFSGGASKLIKTISDTVDEFNLSDEEKQEFKLKMETLVSKRDSEIEQTLRKELEAKERVLIAELNQSDNYTKRARPTLVYAGLLFIFLVHVVTPIVANFTDVVIIDIELPQEFWYTWASVVATWSIGRSSEKIIPSNKASRAVTGTKKINLLD